MRRFLLAFLAFVAAAAGAGAAPVTPERALAVAYRFLNGATKAGGRALRLVWRGEKPAEAPLAEPAYYVYNADGGGFV
ncbi:MAG: Spi family protease inhibitor, partial [Bacteroidales bacterium]|nr:Spi family protease inhibitor [Bacteroidales bacterium]